jgi:ribosomal protein S6
MESRNVKEFERNLLLAEGLMRELIVRIDTVEPSVEEEPPESPTASEDDS